MKSLRGGEDWSGEVYVEDERTDAQRLTFSQWRKIARRELHAGHFECTRGQAAIAQPEAAAIVKKAGGACADAAGIPNDSLRGIDAETRLGKEPHGVADWWLAQRGNK